MQNILQVLRVNRLFTVHKWFPAFNAMGPMIKELYMNREN
ncbi:DUF4188 domain-containing protein [Paenibacillus sp. yr247]|nr:DUF4188 domain-containing protein [Paenibacillus sp. yr247]